MINDEQLLHAYARERSESAFGELVTRHIDFVYSTALRVVNGDSHLAQDVAQTVFIELARMAGSLPDDVALPGWLHRHTCYTATKEVRAERRRKTREETAMEMRAFDDNTRPPWEQVAPYLDESLNQLNPADRDALVLRFLKQQDLRAVGEAVGISEDAARKRVDRALEKLHVLLKHRGATLSAAALGTALATEAVTAAPAGLAGSVTGAALVSAAACGGITATLVKLMATTKLKLGLATLVIAGAATTLVIQHQSQTKLREENESFRQQNAQLKADNGGLSSLTAQTKKPGSLPSDQFDELLRLRGEVGMLRQQTNELARFRQENRKLLSQVAAQSSSGPWIKRINQLQQYLAQHPGEAIPEMQFAEVSAWLNSIQSELETEDALRNASSMFRNQAQMKFTGFIGEAVRQFEQANNGQFPTDLSQLLRYCDPAVGRTMLDLYEIAPRSAVQDTKADLSGDRIITRKLPVNPGSRDRLAVVRDGRRAWYEN